MQIEDMKLSKYIQHVAHGCRVNNDQCEVFYQYAGTIKDITWNGLYNTKRRSR